MYFSLPDVYTQFRKCVEANCPVRNVFNIEKFKPVPDGLVEGVIPTAEDLGGKSKIYFVFLSMRLSQ